MPQRGCAVADIIELKDRWNPQPFPPPGDEALLVAIDTLSAADLLSRHERRNLLLRLKARRGPSPDPAA
jgi:hypothetical protein